jgi:D-alanyl-D-alanine carboxypeptidase
VVSATSALPPATTATAPDGADSPATSTAPVAPTTTLSPVAPARAWQRFDEALASKLLVAGDFAVSVAVAVDGRIEHRSAFGDRDPTVSWNIGGTAPSTSTTTVRPKPNDPVQPTDRFRIASISKVITATVVLQLVEDDVLRLDQPVGELLARHVGVDLAQPLIATITPRQLLSHTSGFPDYDSTFFGGGARSCEEAAQRGLSGDLLGAPGTVYNYSNLNFCLLSLLIEAFTGQRYERVVNDRLLEPLGIKGMRLAGTIDPRDDEVVHPSIPTRNYMEVLGGAGAWVASAAEVVRIVSSLDPSTSGWHPLTKWATRAMLRPAPRPVAYSRPGEQWYGLGLIVNGDGTWGHTGTVENTHAMVLHRPDGVTWSVLVSGEYPGESSRLRSIVDEAFAEAGIRL